MKIHGGFIFPTIKLNTQQAQSIHSFYLGKIFNFCVPELYGTIPSPEAAYGRVNIYHIKRK